MNNNNKPTDVLDQLASAKARIVELEAELNAAWKATGVESTVRGLTTLDDVIATMKGQVLELRDEARAFNSLLSQLTSQKSRYNHVYIDTDCVFCGNYGPDEADQPCIIDERFAQLKRERDEARACVHIREDRKVLTSTDGHQLRRVKLAIPLAGEEL